MLRLTNRSATATMHVYVHVHVHVRVYTMYHVPCIYIPRIDSRSRKYYYGVSLKKIDVEITLSGTRVDRIHKYIYNNYY